jgi:competence protein ComEC
MVLTTPLCALYFGMVSLVGVVTNLLVLWLVSFVFIGILCACAVGFAWKSAGCVLAWVVAWVIRLIQITAKLLASIPWAAVYTCSVYIVAWIAFSYLLLILFLLSKKKRPVQMLACCIAGLCIAIVVSCTEPRLDNYRVTVLDVGQGQCILVQHGKRTYMVDCGGDLTEKTADLAAQALLSQGVFEIDGLILTHYDMDHAGAAEMFLSRVPAKRLYLPDILDNNGIRKSLNKKYKDRICWVQKEKFIRDTNFLLSLYPADTTDKGNESCLGVLFQVEKCDILITGDMGTVAEKALLERSDLPELDLLVVGHHGSASSTSFALLSKTQPKAAVISVSEKNRFGLPSGDVLRRLEMFGVKVLRTDKQGTIIFRG